MKSGLLRAFRQPRVAFGVTLVWLSTMIAGAVLAPADQDAAVRAQPLSSAALTRPASSTVESDPRSGDSGVGFSLTLNALHGTTRWPAIAAARDRVHSLADDARSRRPRRLALRYEATAPPVAP